MLKQLIFQSDGVYKCVCGGAVSCVCAVFELHYITCNTYKDQY